MGWTITPVRKSAKARLLSRMLHGFCNEGVLITVTMMTRLLRNANMASDPLTVTSIKEGNSVLKWYKDNYLLSNPEKLNAIGIKQRNETEQINIKIGDQAIKTSDNIKLLGVNFDENLIFRQY